MSKAKKSPKVSYVELERMLYELYENTSFDAIDGIDGLQAWAEAECEKRIAQRNKLRASALSKLTDAERGALGFPVFVDDEDDDDTEY